MRQTPYFTLRDDCFHHTHTDIVTIQKFVTYFFSEHTTRQYIVTRYVMHDPIGYVTSCPLIHIMSGSLIHVIHVIPGSLIHVIPGLLIHVIPGYDRVSIIIQGR